MTSHMRSVTPPPGGSVQLPSSSASSSSRSKTLMESLLVAKMEQVALGGGPQGRPLIRTDSVDSASSLGSVTSTTSDVCRCDDCLLGIADLYAQDSEERKHRKKVIKKTNFVLLI